jgi:SLT domain-containing protein/phage-related protein
VAEIDKLEIIIEAEAQKANRSMGSLEKRIDAVTEALERCMLVAQGAVSLKGLNIDKLFSGKAMEKSAKDLGKKLADDLIKNYNLGLAGKDVTGEIKSLTNKIASGVANNPGKAYKNLADDMEALGNVVKRNGKISKSTSSDYQELYNWIKKSGKIKITPETARSLGDDYKNRTPVMKQKFSTKDGIELDSYYQEMREQFPAILKEAHSVEDEFYQLDSALKKFYETANSFYTPEWMEDDIWDTIIDGVDDIRVGVNDAKTGVTEFGDALKNAEESGKSFSQMLGSGMDTSGLERAEALVGNITRGNRTEAQKKTHSDLKYPVQPFKDINRKFKDSRLDTDFSKMNIQQLQASISANERLYARVQQAINNMIELEGTDELGGKDWYKKIQQINQYENAIDDATEALGRLNANSFLSGGVDSQKSNRSTKVIDEYVRKAKEAVGEIPAPSFDTEEELIKYIDDLNDKFEELYQVARKAENEIDFGDAIRELAELESELDSARTDLSHFNNGPRKRKVSNEPIDVGNVSDLYNMTFGDGASELAKELEQSGASASEAAAKLNNLNTQFGNKEVVTYEARIRELKKTLSDLSSQGLSEGDPEFDNTLRKIMLIEEYSRRYKKEMKESVKAEVNSEEIDQSAEALRRATAQGGKFKRMLKGLGSFGSKINNISKGFKKVGKTIQNARDIANKAVHPFKTLKELMGFESKKKNNGMPFGRMLGSSIMFSTIFGLISQIKQAIKEGSDNLVQYSSSYNNSISSMVSSLLYLKNAWAVAFAPIVNVVAPYISSFIDMVSSALNAVGHFLAALTGKGYVVQAKKAWKNYGASIADTGKKTDKANDSAKKLQKTILGFDELNILNGNDTGSESGSSGSGSGGSSSPSPSDMFETIEVSNSMNQLADKFKQAFANADFTEIGEIVGNKLKSAMESINWDSVYHAADNFGKSLATFLNGLISPELFYDLGKTIAGSINTALHALNSFAANFDWKDFGASLASSITGFFETWDAKLTGETLSNFATGILESLKSAIDTLDGDKTFEKIGQKLVDFIYGIDWKKLTWDLLGFFKSLTNALVDFPKDFAKGVAQEILNKIFGEDKVELPKVKWFDDLTSWISKMSIRQIPLFDVIFNLIDFKENIEAIVTFVSDMKTNIEKALAPLADFFSSIFSLARENTQSPFAGIGDWFGERKKDIQNGLSGIDEWIGSKFSTGRKNTDDSFKDVGTWFGNRKTDIQTNLKDIDSWMNTKYVNARKYVNAAFSDVGAWFGTRKGEIQTNTDSINTWFNAKYQSARGYVNSAFSNVGSWFGSRKGEIQSNMDSINGWFNTKYQSARGYVNSAFSSIGSWFGSRRNDIQSNMQYISTWFSSTFKTAYNGVTSAFSGIGRYFQNVGNWITSPVKSAINSVGSAVNWIYKKLGGSKDLIPKYATGTGKNGVLNDTFGMVNDQSGGTYRELVQFPNGKAFIPKGRNVVLPMPKGTKVMPAGQTKELMDMNGVPHFKKGAGVFNIIDYIAHPSKLLQYGLDKFTSFRDAVEPGLSIAKQSISAVKDMALSKVKSLVSGFTTSSGGGYSTSGVEQWRNLAKTALLLTNQYTESNLNALLTQMKHESGGNARAINLWDSNAKKGIPSKGLMQVIDPTFRSYALSPYNKDIYDPLSNMIASIRYTVSRYGSLYKGWTARGYKGYKNGGMPVNGEVYIANENGFGSEYIGRMGNKHVVANNQQITDGIKQAVIEGMMEVYMATQSNGTDSNGTIPYIINAVLKTEDNEVLARAVEKGQVSRNSRFNPSPAY